MLAQLVRVPAPNGGTVQADPALRLALDLLASLEDGRPLVQAFAEGGVRLMIAPGTFEDPVAEYDPEAGVVSVDPDVAALAPATVATLLAHEATHVRASIDGTWDREREALGPTAACLADELRATLAELQVWQRLYGPGGKPDPVHEYEAALNEELAAYARDPDRHAAEVEALYAPLCAEDGPRPRRG